MRLCLGCSLKTRIVAVVGLLFVGGISLITFFVTRILHEDMRAMVSKQQLETTQYVAHDIDGKLHLREESLRRIADSIPRPLLSNPDAMQRWLTEQRSILEMFPTGLLIIPPDGGPPIADAPHLKTRPKSFVDRDWFIDVSASKKTVFSKPLIARATNQPAIVIAIPLLRADQSLEGILIGVTPLATKGFLDLILGASPGQAGSYQLISPRHRVFALASDIKIAVTRMPEPGKDRVLDAAIEGVRGIRIIEQPGGARELASIEDIPHANWLLISRQPTVSAFEPVGNTLRNILLIAALLGLPSLIVLLAALNRLLQPIASLARDLHEMAEGTRPMHPIEAQSTREIADVAESFNRLQGKLLEQEQKLASMAMHDTLTGLPNRLAINHRLEYEMLRIQRSKRGLALLFLDLDNFKPINDTYGHQTGDALLIALGERLRSCVRDVDMLARLGGDEFLILLSDTDIPQEAAERVAQACIAALGEPFVVDGHPLQVSASIGLAIAEGGADKQVSPQHLLSMADQAMYKAKSDGRNRYAIYQSEN